MRGPGLLFVAALVTAAPAFAQDPPPPVAENTRAACTDGRDNDGDGHVDCDDQDCQEFTFCVATRPTAAGTNDLAQLRGRGTTRVVIGAVLLSLGLVTAGVSSLLWVGGTTLLAIGAGNLAEARRPRLAFGPTSLAVRF